MSSEKTIAEIATHRLVARSYGVFEAREVGRENCRMWMRAELPALEHVERSPIELARLGVFLVAPAYERESPECGHEFGVIFGERAFLDGESVPQVQFSRLKVSAPSGEGAEATERHGEFVM